MAHSGLWVAALSLVCLIAVVTSDDSLPVTQANTGEDICGQFFNEGSTMTISRVFDMITIKFRDYVPDFGTEMLRNFMQYADSNRDYRLDRSECENLIAYIKNRTPGPGRK